MYQDNKTLIIHAFNKHKRISFYDKINKKLHNSRKIVKLLSDGFVISTKGVYSTIYFSSIEKVRYGERYN